MWRTDSVHARLRFRKNSLFAAKVIMVDILTGVDASATSATRVNVPGGSSKDSRSSGHEPRRRIEESRPEILTRASPSPPHFLHTHDWLHDVHGILSGASIPDRTWWYDDAVPPTLSAAGA